MEFTAVYQRPVSLRAVFLVCLPLKARLGCQCGEERPVAEKYPHQCLRIELERNSKAKHSKKLSLEYSDKIIRYFSLDSFESCFTLVVSLTKPQKRVQLRSLGATM